MHPFPINRRELLAAGGAAALAGGPAFAAESPGRIDRSREGMVVSVSAAASEVGRRLLAEGGNAVDAAVGVAFALAVVHPPAGNIGGGGFMMIHSPCCSPPVCIDYRERAPLKATRDMFADGGDLHGHAMVGTPGTVAGLALAHERLGKLPWKRLVEPAVHLAADGFPLEESLAESLNEVLRDSPDHRELQRVLGQSRERPWQAGDRLVQADLAESLAQIGARGADAFYKGEVAKKLVAEMQAGGGLISAEDLQGYRALLRRPIHASYRGFDLFGPPPPSSGGIVLKLALNILGALPTDRHERFAPQTLHLIVEVMRRAFCERARSLGDADFVDIPPRLTDKQYAVKLAKGIDLQRATPSASLAPEIPLAGEGDNTTHFSVIDKDGLAVSNTYTLEQSYGSRIVVGGAGFLLNNEMGDFNWRAGRTDRNGRIGTPANLIAPG
ncbi:MAG: gamma-glutamyltransferase, partial [Planctomycetales bacterium]|nr:gamma-glutamyltransferase [Planctomycetales bacterium]